MASANVVKADGDGTGQLVTEIPGMYAMQIDYSARVSYY